METAVTIDAELLREAIQVSGGQPQHQLVEEALKLLIMQKKQNVIRKYRGKLRWEGNLDELRAAKWSL